MVFDIVAAEIIAVAAKSEADNPYVDPMPR